MLRLNITEEIIYKPYKLRYSDFSDRIMVSVVIYILNFNGYLFTKGTKYQIAIFPRDKHNVFHVYDVNFLTELTK